MKGPGVPGMKRAVFVDKDGTLVVDIPYNVDPARVRLSAGAGMGLRRLHDSGYLLAVITNQSGVALGYFPESALGAVELEIRRLLSEFGVTLSGFYYCPHHPEGSTPGYDVACECRKPRPGLILSAAAALGVDLARSWFVGDILDDVEAGRRAGCRTVLIDNGNETEWVRTADREPHRVAADLGDAAELIVKGDEA